MDPEKGNVSRSGCDMSDFRVLVIAVLPCRECTLLATPSMAPVSYFVGACKACHDTRFIAQREQMVEPREIIAPLHDNILRKKPIPTRPHGGATAGIIMVLVWGREPAKR